MAETLINLMIQLLAGAIGGNAAGAAFKDYGLGMLGNPITGVASSVRRCRQCCLRSRAAPVERKSVRCSARSPEAAPVAPFSRSLPAS